MPRHGNRSQTSSRIEIGLYDVAFSPDGKILATGGGDASLRSGDGAVLLWDTETWESKGTLATNARSVFTVAFSPDGVTLAGGSGDGTVRLWDTETWELKRTLPEQMDRVYRVAFSPDGAAVASTMADGTVRLWDTETGEPKGTLTGGYTDGVT